MSISVRLARIADTPAVASIHADAFPRQRDSATWVAATLAAAPRFLAYVLEQHGEVAGYAFWAQKSGIRPAAVLELEQIAVHSKWRGAGLGERLIQDSLALAAAQLASNGQTIQSLLVSTRADNQAQRLYARILGAKIAAEIENLYSATEVFMVAKYPPDLNAKGDG